MQIQRSLIVNTLLTSCGSWMALSSTIVICLFMAISWLDSMMGHKQAKVELPHGEIRTPSILETETSSRHFASEGDNPPCYASIQIEVPPPPYSNIIVEQEGNDCVDQHVWQEGQ